MLHVHVFKMKVGHQGVWDDQTAVIFQRHLQASIFDSVDIHVDKLTVVLPSFPVGQDDSVVLFLDFCIYIAILYDCPHDVPFVFKSCKTSLSQHLYCLSPCKQCPYLYIIL